MSTGVKNGPGGLLHTASSNGHVEVVKLLLAHPNINVNVENWKGQTPFSKGCWNGQVSVVEVLLKDPRVDITLDDKKGCTPLWWASRSGHLEVVEWFIAVAEIWETSKTRKGHIGWQRRHRP